AAPSSAQTSPSQTTNRAPKIQPSIACGPPIAAMMRGMVMNGPTPIMSIIFSVVAPQRLTPRINCCSASFAADGDGDSVCPDIREDSLREKVALVEWVTHMKDQGREFGAVA